MSTIKGVCMYYADTAPLRESDIHVIPGCNIAYSCTCIRREEDHFVGIIISLCLVTFLS